ncbi:TniQ family protein (plasmid) [Streptomyces scopuliridis]|uniref:TniQ family protein n=2 Tax=Streptomyces scopuliridis TaxID=452529 RepID=A0ACD4ZY62_9ACTN|nr:TniQ family protein [Streptomyces scopuliridis]WSB34810.1 TniQ family protein [Streptomyces scopuliridis]WSB99060.1 TniQ family protein [Streptomyces scopuliridis]WSC03473.1 TniQ family protein [Streptomyces scopuliridis]WSC07238.1 TniQ family protein [Streptomyces scopuliridis]WSC11382.1 TniQ family protein [Streptomyces scopuliridis]
MTSGLRTLPIRVAPLPGEALDSWLETLAHRSMVSFREILIALGLPGRRDGNLPDLTRYLESDQAEQAAAVGGVPADRLHAMTLRQYDGHALILHPHRRTVNRMQLWGRNGSRYCPQCLHEHDGRWQLRWRLPWSFACTRHRILLPHACPSCNQRTRHGRVSIFRDLPPHQCPTTLKPSGALCQTDLTLAPAAALREDSPVLASQRWINDLLDRVEQGQAQSLPAPRMIFNDLRALASWVLRIAEPGDFPTLDPHVEQACQDYAGDGQFSPTSAAVTAGGLTRAVHILQQGSDKTNIATLRTLLERDGERLDLMPLGDINKRWRAHSTALQQLIWQAMDTRMANVDRLRFRSCTTRPRPPHKMNETLTAARAGRVPQLLWRGWTARFLPAAGVRNIGNFRAALAVALLLPGASKRHFDPLISMLGHQAQLDVHYTLAELAQQGHDGVLTGLCEIADYLDTQPVPIDYERRRGLTGEGLLPADDWVSICTQTGVHPGQEARLLSVRRYLYQRITGNDLRQAPESLRITTAEETGGVAVVPFRITAALLGALDKYGENYLRGLGIDEPLTWEPPADLAAGLCLPGRPVDVTRAHRLICAEGQAPAVAAKEMGVALESIRHCFEQHPPSSPWPSKSGGSWVDPSRPIARRSRLAAAQARQQAHTVLTNEFLRSEYLDARKTVREIASETRLPKRLISEVLNHSGLIASREPSRKPIVDEQWLREQYIRQARTLASIATELDMSPTTLTRHLRAMGIALRPRGGRRAVSQLELDSVPPLIRPALTDRRCWGRLQRFREAMKHRTLAEASRQLGTTRSVLYTQFAALEGDLGVQLYIRPRRGESLRPTKAGQAVMDALTDSEGARPGGNTIETGILPASRQNP